MKDKRKPNKENKSFSIHSHILIQSIDKYTRKILKTYEHHNLVVNDGLNMVRNWLAGDSLNSPVAIALGTDDTAPSASDISLGTEVERETAIITKPTNYQVRYTKIFSVGSGVSYTIKEAGLFDNIVESGSIMFARLSADNTLDSDTDLSVQLTYTISTS